MLKVDFPLVSVVNIINVTDINDVDYHIAMTFFQIYEDIPNMSMSELADKCHVSMSVLRKFIQNVYGVPFNEFKHDVLTSIPIRRKQIIDRYQVLDKNLLIKNLLPLTTHKNVNDFCKKEQIERICKMIHDSQRVIMYGGSTLLQLAYDFQVDMRIIGVKVIHSSLIQNNLIVPNENDLIWICSLKGRLFNVQAGKGLEIFLLSHHKKVIITKDEINSHWKECEVLTLNTRNETYEGHYIYLYYLDMIKTCYYEKYAEELC